LPVETRRCRAYRPRRMTVEQASSKQSVRGGSVFAEPDAAKKNHPTRAMRVA
jgi:hypothetical protein